MNMSCEIPSETLSFCIHGTPVKFECAKCSLEHRLKLLESKINNLIAWKEVHINTMAGISDEIRKISKSISKYAMKMPHKCPVCDGCGMRANPLRVKNYENAMIPINLDCMSCDGKGIIWG